MGRLRLGLLIEFLELPFGFCGVAILDDLLTDAAKISAAMGDDANGQSSIRISDFASQYQEEKESILHIVDQVFSSGIFVGLERLEEFEKAIANYCDVKHAVGVGSGTDALFLSLRALGVGPGDEVITPANSHFSSTSAIIHVGGTPVFADVKDNLNIDPAAIEAAITSKTKVIMPVHLTGRIADMNEISEIARKKGLRILEDAAQSIGAEYHGRRSGSFGDAAAFSAHPLKNLNAAGDAGYITTNDDQVASRLRTLRNNGLLDRDHVLEWGYVARLDVLQAEFLKMRLLKLDNIIETRRAHAELYRKEIKVAGVMQPECAAHERNSYHTFIIQCEDRDGLKDYLAANGVQSAVHYPEPIHLQPAAVSLGFERGSLPVTESLSNRILTLPVNQYLRAADIQKVSSHINEFYGS